jgi:hypothetical protein
MKILLLVHIEETFRHFFPKGMTRRIIKHAGKFDKIIHFTSHVNDDSPVKELIPVINEVHEWGWGYEPECFEYAEEEIKFVIPALGHKYTWIPPILRDTSWLKGSKVYLGGGYNSECLQDMVDILRHMNINYKKIHSFIYGN